MIPQEGKINIILDLDNTLISAIDKKEEKKLKKSTLKSRMALFDWKDMQGDYKVFARPHLQEFLTWLFSHFNVSVWTAASKSYALFIIEQFIIANKPNRRLDYIFFSHHCRESKIKYKWQKVLSLLHTNFHLKYDIDRTFIIDDHDDVYTAQPNNCIRIQAFDISHKSCEKDADLKRIMRSLELIRLKYS